MKEALFGPPGLILLGAVISAVGALWAASQQASFERELRARSDEVVKLTQTALYSVTGGNSFCYFHFMDRAPGLGELIVVPPKEYPLYDVAARVVDLDRVNAAKSHEDRMNALAGINVPVGNLTPGFSRSVIAWKLLDPNQLRLNVFYVARNGGSTQLYRRVRVKDGWALAIKVELNGKVVLEEVSASYPREPDGQVKWE